MSDVVANGSVVIFHYTLTDDDGTVLDTSRERGEPMPYLHGAGNIVPGLERQLEGKTSGDRIEAVVPPDEGYGVPQGDGPRPVPRSAFPEGLEIHEGMQFVMEDGAGQSFPVWVTAQTAEEIMVDINHPLAGTTLHFDIEIVRLRAATEDELTHGHPHGLDGTEGHGH